MDCPNCQIEPKIDKIEIDSANKPCCPNCLDMLIKRVDDHDKIIKNRFRLYQEYTVPVEDFFDERGLLHKINARKEIEPLFKEFPII